MPGPRFFRVSPPQLTTELSHDRQSFSVDTCLPAASALGRRILSARRAFARGGLCRHHLSWEAGSMPTAALATPAAEEEDDIVSNWPAVAMYQNRQGQGLSRAPRSTSSCSLPASRIFATRRTVRTSSTAPIFPPSKIPAASTDEYGVASAPRWWALPTIPNAGAQGFEGPAGRAVSVAPRLTAFSRRRSGTSSLIEDFSTHSRLATDVEPPLVELKNVCPRFAESSCLPPCRPVAARPVRRELHQHPRRRDAQGQGPRHRVREARSGASPSTRRMPIAKGTFFFFIRNADATSTRSWSARKSRKPSPTALQFSFPLQVRPVCRPTCPMKSLDEMTKYVGTTGRKINSAARGVDREVHQQVKWQMISSPPLRGSPKGRLSANRTEGS